MSPKGSDVGIHTIFTDDHKSNSIKITLNMILFLQCMTKPLMCVIVPVRRTIRTNRSVPLILSLPQ